MSKEVTEAAVRNAVSRSIEDLRGASPSFDEFYEGLRQLGTVVVFGGAARDWSRGRCPRDLDLIVDAPSADLLAYMKLHRSRRNPFGGFEYHIRDCDLAYLPAKVDLWALKDTWALRSFPERFIAPTLADIQQTVFFNLDAILVEPEPNGFLDIEGCLETLRAGVLDIVLEMNPFPQFCVVKALVQASKYQLTLSPRLLRYCNNQAATGLRWSTVLRHQRINWGAEVVSREQAAELLGVEFRFADEPEGTQTVGQMTSEPSGVVEILEKNR